MPADPKKPTAKPRKRAKPAAGASAAGKRKTIDWVAIEVDYRAGILTIREMAAKHGVSKSRIDQVAAEKEWTRDLKGKIKAKAEDKVNRAVLDKKLDKQREVSSSEVIESASDDMASIVLTHRQDWKDCRELVKRMLMELAATTMTVEQIHLLANAHLALEAGPDGVVDQKKLDKTISAWLKSLGIHDRATSVQKLIAAIATITDRERINYGLDEADRGKPQDVVPLEERLNRYREAAQIQNSPNVVPMPERKTA